MIRQSGDVIEPTAAAAARRDDDSRRRVVDAHGGDVVGTSDDDGFAVDGDHAEPRAFGLLHVLWRGVTDVHLAAVAKFGVESGDVGGELNVIVGGGLPGLLTEDDVRARGPRA